MKENDIIKAIGNIDDSFIEEAAPNGFVKKKSPGFTLGLMGRWAGAFVSAVSSCASVLISFDIVGSSLSLFSDLWIFSSVFLAFQVLFPLVLLHKVLTPVCLQVEIVE